MTREERLRETIRQEIAETLRDERDPAGAADRALGQATADAMRQHDNQTADVFGEEE